MLGKGLNDREKRIVFMSAIGAMLMLVAILNERLLIRYFIQSKFDEKSVGLVISARNDVRRRMRSSLTWYPAFGKDGLYEKDSLFTGYDSEMLIRVADAQNISLGPNSFAVLQTQEKDVVFDLLSGSLATTGAGEGNVKLKLGDKLAEVSSPAGGGPIYINKSKSGDINILSTSGTVEIEMDGQKKVIQKNEEMSIDAKFNAITKKYPLNFSSFKYTDKIWLRSGEKVSFQWTGSSDKPTLKFQIASDPNMKKPLFEEKLKPKQSQLQWVPAEMNSVYHYRIYDEAANNSLTPTQTLNVNEQKQISLYYPANYEVLFSKSALAPSDSRPVNFGWEAIKDVPSYFVEVAKDKDFTNIIIAKPEEKNYIDYKLNQGTYYWRVRTSRFANDPFTSTTFKFALGQPGDDFDFVPKMYGPERPPSDFNKTENPRVPQASQNIVLKFSPEADPQNPESLRRSLINPPVLAWEPMPGATSYRLEIDDSGKFSKPQKFDNISNNKLTWREVKPGRYYWRVIGKNSESDESQPSPAVKLTTRVPAPEIVTKDKLKDEVTSPKALRSPVGIQLSWNSVPYAKAYKLTGVGIDSAVLENTYALKLTPNEKKEVAIVALDGAGKPISESETYEFQYIRNLKLDVPKIILPADNTTVIAFDKTKISPLVFTWKAVPHADGYDLQFSTDAKFNRIVLDEKVTQSRFVLKSRLGSGIIYWRVRSRYKKFESEFTSTRKYTIQVSK